MTSAEITGLGLETPKAITQCMMAFGEVYLVYSIKTKRYRATVKTLK